MSVCLQLVLLYEIWETFISNSLFLTENVPQGRRIPNPNVLGILLTSALELKDWKENEDGGVHVATMLPSAQKGLAVILLWWFPQVDRPFRRFYLVSSGSKSWSVAFTLWCELVCSIPSCLRLTEMDTNFSEQVLLESFFFKRDHECDWSIVILFDLPDSFHHSCFVWGEIRCYHSQFPAINYECSFGWRSSRELNADQFSSHCEWGFQSESLWAVW